MKFEYHCEESRKLFGAPFEEVHRWLDEFAGLNNIGMKHRRFRHHEAGLKEVEKLFGKDAVPVAKQHIISDLIKEEGWNPNKDKFSKDSNDYKKMGLF